MKVAWICGINPYYFRNTLKIKDHDLLQHSAMTWIHTLVREFEKHNSIELFIISSSYHVRKDVHFEKNNVEYFILRRQLPFISLPKRLFNKIPALLKLRYYYFRRKTKGIIKSINPDIINTHGTENEFSLPALDTKIPTIVEIQGYINDIILQTSNTFLKRQLIYENEVFKKGKYFIIHTNYMDKVILNQNSDAKLFRCHYAVDHTAFELSELQKDADVCFAANLIRRKGIFDLIEACNLVKNSFPFVKVKIIGRSTKENFSEVQRLVNYYNLQENFIFLGYLTKHLDLLSEVKRSKITVLPTYADTSPGSIGESMALGVPAIAYNVGGIPDMIQDNNTGILIEKGDTNGLADAIVYLLSNEEVRVRMGMQSKEFAQRNWSPSSVVEKMISIYQEVLSL